MHDMSNSQHFANEEQGGIFLKNTKQTEKRKMMKEEE